MWANGSSLKFLSWVNSKGFSEIFFQRRGNSKPEYLMSSWIRKWGRSAWVSKNKNWFHLEVVEQICIHYMQVEIKIFNKWQIYRSGQGRVTLGIASLLKACVSVPGVNLFFLFLSHFTDFHGSDSHIYAYSYISTEFKTNICMADWTALLWPTSTSNSRLLKVNARFCQSPLPAAFSPLELFLLCHSSQKHGHHSLAPDQPHTRRKYSATTSPPLISPSALVQPVVSCLDAASTFGLVSSVVYFTSSLYKADRPTMSLLWVKPLMVPKAGGTHCKLLDMV